MQRAQGLYEIGVADGRFGSMDDLRAWARQVVADAVAADGGTLVYFNVVSAAQDPPIPYNPPDGF